jgi:hypothetical protein
MSYDNLAAVGGRFLEWLRREMVETLKIAIHGRGKRPHDIGSLWPSACGKLKKKHQRFKHTHPASMDQLDANVWVRHAYGAHYNPTPTPPTQEIREVAPLPAALYHGLWFEQGGRCFEEQADASWRCVCASLPIRDAPQRVTTPRACCNPLLTRDVAAAIISSSDDEPPTTPGDAEPIRTGTHDRRGARAP